MDTTTKMEKIDLTIRVSIYFLIRKPLFHVLIINLVYKKTFLQL